MAKLLGLTKRQRNRRRAEAETGVKVVNKGDFDKDDNYHHQDIYIGIISEAA
jgi:hypothetical protein